MPFKVVWRPPRSWLSQRAEDLRLPWALEVPTMRAEMSEKREKYDREFGEGIIRVVGEIGKPIMWVVCDLSVVGACWAIGSSRSGRSEGVMVGLVGDDAEELDRSRAENAMLRMERGVLR